MLVRLQKVLAAAGVASRREAETLIASGRVSVNGQVVQEPGTKVDPAVAAVAVDGRPLPGDVPRLTLMLNKPRGFVTTKKDPHAPRTVMDLLAPALTARVRAGEWPQAAVD